MRLPFIIISRKTLDSLRAENELLSDVIVGLVTGKAKQTSQDNVKDIPATFYRKDETLWSAN